MMHGRGRKRTLSKDERELWERVTFRDEPLARSGPAAAAEAQPETKTSRMAKPRDEVADRKTLAKPPAKMAKTRVKPALEPPLPAPFDPKIGKHLSRGRRPIDARLDLHGLRRQDAHAELRRFLNHAQARGFRHVLIITGKGKPEESGDFWNSEERGVLRRLLPNWLSEPALRSQVVSFTESSLRHGGSGALYVTIRKKR